MKVTKKEKQGVLNEDLDSKLDLILEQNTEILKMKPTVEKIEKRLGNVEHDVAALKIGHQQMSQDIKEVKKTLAMHDDKLDSIQKTIDKKADSTETRELDRRVTKLESRALI